MKIIKEAMDNVPELNSEEVQPVIDPVTAEAKKESDKKEEENKQFFDAELIKEKEPFLGAIEQPEPEEVQMPKFELEESLFEDAPFQELIEEVVNESKPAPVFDLWEKVYNNLNGSLKSGDAKREIGDSDTKRYDDDHIGSDENTIRVLAGSQNELKLAKEVAKHFNVPIRIKKTSGYSDPTKAYEADIAIPSEKVKQSRPVANKKKPNIVLGQKNPVKDHTNEELELNEDYGWKVQQGKEFDLLQELIDIYGSDDIIMSLAKAMGTAELGETLAYICRNYDFTSQFLED